MSGENQTTFRIVAKNHADPILVLRDEYVYVTDQGYLIHKNPHGSLIHAWAPGQWISVTKLAPVDRGGYAGFQQE